MRKQFRAVDSTTCYFCRREILAAKVTQVRKWNWETNKSSAWFFPPERYYRAVKRKSLGNFLCLFYLVRCQGMAARQPRRRKFFFFFYFFYIQCFIQCIQPALKINFTRIKQNTLTAAIFRCYIFLLQSIMPKTKLIKMSKWIVIGSSSFSTKHRVCGKSNYEQTISFWNLNNSLQTTWSRCGGVLKPFYFFEL